MEMHGLCSQKCTNTAGSYQCLCDKGYKLRADNQSCQAVDEHVILLYTTQVTVMSVELRTKRVQTVADNLTKVIGVAFDGAQIFWTNLENEAESIVRAKLDGSEQQILLTSGLDAPEDLAVDWLTGNIYFSDHNLHHIAVCSNDGVYCTVLVTREVHQPRGIALWPQLGQMFWTDWGDKPMIARAAMDGTNMQAIISENIHWPNGIALDMHNNRVYWVDAKLSTIESARPDGTDRRLVLQDILKHPYGLAVFEENLYWSDWGTKSVHSCHKFTGKNHQVVVKDRTIYAVHIYHAAKQPQTEHACKHNYCSHLCLLSENYTYACACPYDMELSADQHRCVKTQKKQKLFIGLKNTLLEMEHTTFGRDEVESSHILPINVDEMVYNSVNGTLIIADNMRKTLYEYDMVHNVIVALTSENLGNITSIAFDHLAYNVYWTDSTRHSVEVLSLQTREKAIVTFFSGQEKPIALTVVPDDGIMFVALRNRQQIHIDQIPLSGRGDHVHVIDENLGNREIRFAVDYDNAILYWSDSDLGRVSFSSYRSFQSYTFRSRLRRPYDLALVDGDLFWSELRSSTIHWTHSSNQGALKRVDIEATKEAGMPHYFPPRVPLVASVSPATLSHPCQKNNGGCSHICTSFGIDASACLCPPGLVFKDRHNRTCIESLDCEFRCLSGECLTMAHRCNAHKDCADGSDEQGCDADEKHKKAKAICHLDQFLCHNGEQCVDNEQRCDGQADCKDNSDEMHCEKFDNEKNCHQHQFACQNGKCIDLNAYCDGNNDCEDNSDEEDCESSNSTRVCGKDMFQCSRGSCIPKIWECDGKLDCTDGSDEHVSCNLRDCVPPMHRCLLGQCIDEKLKCDGHNDCGDYSDEMNCGLYSKKLNHNCSDHEYQCQSNASLCLPMVAKCNGTAECPRGEDEADCGEVCSIHEFQCKTTKECIRAEFHCDHERDCADGSDELNCHHANNNSSFTYEHYESVCEPGMFDCKDNTCVDQSAVCNNFEDCANGADESALCKTACSTNVCAHKCRPLPTGALCSCYPGYKLDADKRGCLDIDECEMNPCAQICENTRGSYRCSCYPDFMLRADKTSCKSIESNASLYFISYNEVRSMSEHPITLKVAFSANDSKVQGFDIDVHRRRAYFTTEEANTLYSADLQTGVLGAALSLESASKVAVDWITGNVYVINRAKHYQISVCSFETEMCGVVVSMQGNEHIKALAIDAYNRKMFFVTTHTLTFGMTFAQINVANLDGKKRQYLYTQNGGYITALAVDVHKKQLYFVDSHAKTLQTLSYREGVRPAAKTLIHSRNVVTYTTGLTIYENEAFLVNVGSREAIRCFLFGEYACHTFNINVMNAEDIVVDGASRQPLRKDPCIMAACKGMCVQAEYGYECMCGDEIVLEHSNCYKHHQNAITFERLEENGIKSTVKSHSLLTIILLVIMLIIIAFGYLFYRRTAQGHRDFNINLHFQNPLSSSMCGGKSNNNNGASKNCDKEWQKVRFGVPTIQRLMQNKGKNTGTEMLLQTSERNEFCALGEAGQPNVMVHENYVKYDAGRTRNETGTRIVTDLI